jgi:hypothetical protein
MKGLAVKTIIEFVIGVIVLLIISPFLFKAASSLWEQLIETFGIVSFSPIEKSLICYYYLCKEGCNSAQFNDFCSQDKIGIENYEEMCSLPTSLGIGANEICSKTPFQFPLKISLSKEEEISKDRMSKKIDNLLIATEDTTRT